MRIENDHYPTPRWMTECLIKHADIKGSIFEPCAGQDHAIASIFKDERYRVITNDLYYKNSDFQLSVLDADLWHIAADRLKPDWIISNPPYSAVQATIERSMAIAEVGVAMLLRVTADEMVVSPKEQARAHWWADHPEDLSIKMPRFSFAKSSKTGNWTTDSAYCQWFVWRKDGHKYDKPVVRIPRDRIPGFHRKPLETTCGITVKFIAESNKVRLQNP
jgi:hypothetical protein